MKLKQCLCVFLSLLFAVSLAGCREKTDPIYEQTIQYNLESEPSSLDPQIADDQSAQIVIMSLFEGLTRIGPDGEAKPGVAERWSITATTRPLPFICGRTPAGRMKIKPR